ncbi:MAG: hypothetical protein ACK50A_13910 [Sphingobacteriaceae bacterium]|jgi:hypothetical protein
MLYRQSLIYGIFTINHLNKKTSMIKKLVLSSIFLMISYSTYSQKDSVLVKIYDISIDSMGDVKWKTDYYDHFDITIERLKNNKWIYAGGRSSWTEYIDKVSPLTEKHTSDNTVRVKFHKGINKYRLVLKSPTKKNIQSLN